MNKRIIEIVAVFIVMVLYITILIACLEQKPEEPEEPEIREALYIYFLNTDNDWLGSMDVYIDYVSNCTYMIQEDMIEIYSFTRYDTTNPVPITYKTKLSNVIIIEKRDTNPVQ